MIFVAKIRNFRLYEYHRTVVVSADNATHANQLLMESGEICGDTQEVSLAMVEAVIEISGEKFSHFEPTSRLVYQED